MYANTADILAAHEAVKKYPSKVAAARALGIPRTTLNSRLEQQPAIIKGRKELPEFTDGVILVGSDGHYHPGSASTAHRAFLKFCRKLKPNIKVLLLAAI